MLRVSVKTLGDELDPDGYSVLVDGSERGTVNPIGSLLLSDLLGGMHTVELVSIADNCRVTNPQNPNVVVVTPGLQVDLSWDVFCLPPDAGRIFFVRNGSAILSMSAIGGDERFVTLGTRLAVSADGSKIAFTQGDAPPLDIWVANADGTERTNLTNTPDVDERDPSFSPDGERIAYETFDEGSTEQDVFVMNVDGSNPMNLTNMSAAFDGDPAWSPDGAQIVFRSHRQASPAGDLYVINVDGSGVTGPLTGNRGHLWALIPHWSPDGSRIVYMGATTPEFYDVFVIAPDGSGRDQLTAGPLTSTDATWSPDGRWITFASNRSGFGYQIYVMRPDGSDVVQLTTESFGDQPNWGPAP